jgi:hypothetical protein
LNSAYIRPQPIQGEEQPFPWSNSPEATVIRTEPTFIAKFPETFIIIKNLDNRSSPANGGISIQATSLKPDFIHVPSVKNPITVYGEFRVTPFNFTINFQLQKMEQDTAYFF